MAAVVGIGGASAQTNTVATPNGTGESLIYNLSQMTPVKDQWSSTQSPLDAANMQAMRLGAGESGQGSVSELAVNFRLGSTLVIHDYLNNNSALAILDRALQDSELLSKVDYIVI
ncbi:MAG: hypothetical protein LBM20_08350, partial [Rikenellaceae bacterium]|nr:hypothetical protein [Rikenellaceae bacterium]